MNLLQVKIKLLSLTVANALKQRQVNLLRFVNSPNLSPDSPALGRAMRESLTFGENLAKNRRKYSDFDFAVGKALTGTESDSLMFLLVAIGLFLRIIWGLTLRLIAHRVHLFFGFLVEMTLKSGNFAAKHADLVGFSEIFAILGFFASIFYAIRSL